MRSISLMSLFSEITKKNIVQSEKKTSKTKAKLANHVKQLTKVFLVTSLIA